MKRLALIASIACCMLAAGSSKAQSFHVLTDVTLDSGLYTYSFTFDYDRLGEENPLSEPVWIWSFNIPTDFGSPIAVSSPTGWEFAYDEFTGDCVWYTEGPGGWVNGDFGAYTIPVGGSLGGFSLKTPLEPAEGLVLADDTAFSEDFGVATIPAVNPVPEPCVALALGGASLLVVVRRRRAGRRRN